MRFVNFSPVRARIASYVYRRPGDIKAVHLVACGQSARPPKARDGTGTGDRSWLLQTRFLTVDFSADSEVSRVLIGIADDVDIPALEAEALSGIREDYTVVALPEKDAEFVANSMGLPLLMITQRDEDGDFRAVYRRAG